MTRSLQSCLFAAVAILTCLTALEARPVEDPSTAADFWIKRRAEFRRNTTFELTEDNIRLLGGKFSPVRTGYLPFWFDFELYKTVFKKSYANADEELARHNEYIKTCVRTLKQRVLFRILAATQDAFITREADLFYEERMPAKPEAEEPAVGGDADVIMFAVEFEPQEGSELAADDYMNVSESPVDKAVRLIRAELGQTESRNQLNQYLMEFHEVDGSAIAAKLPY